MRVRISPITFKKKENKMNASQKNYAISRIEIILVDKLNKARKKYEIKLTNYQKYNLVKDGKAKLMPFKNNRYSFELEYNFDSFEKEADSVPIFIEFKKMIEEKCQLGKDNIWLVDSEKAMKIIKELESIKI